MPYYVTSIFEFLGELSCDPCRAEKYDWYFVIGAGLGYISQIEQFITVTPGSLYDLLLPVLLEASVDQWTIEGEPGDF
jgi:hypothetical protein